MPRRRSPRYGVYECAWQHCDAKLHNLSTLRRHLLRVHAPAEGETAMACYWAGCGSKWETFSREKMVEHLESHVSEVAWVKGEGPSAVLRKTPRDESDLVSKPYLFDSTGHPLIARATTHDGRGHPPTIHLPAIPKALSGFHKLVGARGNDVAKAKQIKRAMDLRVASLGVGVYRGGCTFMNDERRERVVMRPGVWEVVPAKE